MTIMKFVPTDSRFDESLRLELGSHLPNSDGRPKVA